MDAAAADSIAWVVKCALEDELGWLSVCSLHVVLVVVPCCNALKLAATSSDLHLESLKA